MEFALPDGLSITTPNKTTQFSLKKLGHAWPARLRVSQLIPDAIQETQQDTHQKEFDDLKRKLEASLLTAFATSSGRLLELSIAPLDSDSQNDSDSFPCVNRYVRRSAKLGQVVVNKRHDIVEVAPVDRHILPLLNGSITPAQIVSKLIELHQFGKLQICDEHDDPIDQLERVQVILEQIVPERLHFYFRSSLLEVL